MPKLPHVYSPYTTTFPGRLDSADSTSGTARLEVIIHDPQALKRIFDPRRKKSIWSRHGGKYDDHDADRDEVELEKGGKPGLAAQPSRHRHVQIVVLMILLALAVIGTAASIGLLASEAPKKANSPPPPSKWDPMTNGSTFGADPMQGHSPDSSWVYNYSTHSHQRSLVGDGNVHLPTLTTLATDDVPPT